MREIKFRQPLLNLQGKFQEWFYWGFINGGFTAPLRQDVPNYQYTGLKDKQRREIYEGDIVDAWSQGSHAIGTITWCISGFFIKIPPPRSIWNLAGTEEICEVIGNIYENPELIKN